MAEPYDIYYSQDATDDVRPLRVYDQRLVLDGIEQHLSYQPRLVSRTRIKEMSQPFWSQFRLRIKGFRIYYDVHDESRSVYVLRIVEKTSEQTPEIPP